MNNTLWIIIYSLWGCWNTCSKINKNPVYTGHIHLHLPISPCNRSDVNLSCFMLLSWSSCRLNTDNIPCIFLYPYLVFTVNVYIILMWTLRYQSEPDSYWSSNKSIGFPLTTRSYFCARAHAYKGFYTWWRFETYFLNCLRKIPTFIPLLESKMLIWENRGIERVFKTDGKIHKGQTVYVLSRSIIPIQILGLQVLVASWFECKFQLNRTTVVSYNRYKKLFIYLVAEFVCQTGHESVQLNRMTLVNWKWRGGDSISTDLDEVGHI